MANMNHCVACSQHYYLFESTCPHCGTLAAGGPVRRFARQARVGGLMLFTALTTTACYGSPAMMTSPVPGTGAGVERPEPAPRLIPKRVGNASMYVTPKGAPETVTGYDLAKAELKGTTLTLRTASGELLAQVEAPDMEAFTPPAPNEPHLALPVEKMKKLALRASYVNPRGQKVALEVDLPGATGVQAVLQLARLDDASVMGVLIVDYADVLAEFYFHAAR